VYWTLNLKDLNACIEP